jgi:general nucleoside transport system ATP-binding protein
MVPLPATAGTAPAVAMRHIHKRFGAVHANRDVQLTVRAGTVHGIVGENGAGKSTLMSILYGFYQADSGEIAIEGKPARIAGSREAIALGIGMVHQHFMLVDTLSALDNVMLGAEPGWRLTPARAQVRARLDALMRDTGLTVNLDATVHDLPVGSSRMRMRALRERGTTILLITHKLREIMALCDQVTVMRGGQVVLDAPIGQVSIDGLAEAMVGRRVNLGRDGRRAEPGAVLLNAQGLTWRDALGVARLAEVSLTLRAGEIVGVAGVSGNGQSELLDVLSGLLAPQQGTLELGGRRFAPPHWLDTRTARELRLAHVPEDRHKRGLVLPFDAWESAVLGYQHRPRYNLRGWMRRQAMRDDCAQMMERYDVRPRNPLLRSSKFSGGNQQKLVLAREAQQHDQEPQVLLVGQPTRGVDIGAIEFIHSRLRAMRDRGGAVLVVSSELDEILALSDRVVVMNAGRISGELPIDACTEAALGRLMGGAH